MKTRHVLITLVIVLPFAVASMLLFLLGSSTDGPAGEIGTALAVSRELHCAEDEDVIVSLGDNGLPFAWCEQVWER